MVLMEDLPMEILQLILRQLSGVQLVQCRRVSRAWRAAVDALPDDAWRRVFIRDRGDCSADVRRAKLSWRDMYRSISLWPHISKAHIKISEEFPSDNIVDFKVLNDGTLALLQSSTGKKKYLENFYSDTVIYYSMENFQELNRQKYDVHFVKYNENDKFITFIQEDNQLCIILKKNNNKKFLYKLSCYDATKGVYYLCNNKVIFLDKEEGLCFAQLFEKNGKAKIKIKEKEFFEEPLAYSHKCRNGECRSQNLNLLTTEGDIYKNTGDDFDCVDELNEYTWFHLYMADYNFDWTTPTVLEWLYHHFDNERLGITKYDFSTIHEYRNILLIGTPNGEIHIYVNPYIPGAGLRSFETKGDRIIELSKLSPPKTGKVTELFVLERTNGHRIVTLMSGHVFLLDLIHSH